MSFLREPDAIPIPGYRLIEPLGSGGYGEVWKCEAPGGLFKAIKFVFGNLNSLDMDAVRAEQELNALNRVKEVRHPFVLSMERIEVVEGELVIVMELADKSLHDLFEECQSAGMIGIPRDDLLRYIRDSAEALDYMCEKHGLQHLDVKPRNLFLVGDRVKVADFGLVKNLERSGASGVLGGVTPLYAAPETFAGKISPTSDQYSLAIVYVELLTSQRPFNGKNARMLAQQHLNEPPELRILPEAERSVVARALAKDPTQRFPNCLAFVRALYNARSPTGRGAPLAEPRAPRPGRPKSIADTLEDLFLEQAGHEDGEDDQLVEVDLGAEPKVDEGSRLGLTTALPETGSLRPTLLIGLGSLGRRALLDLRCRFLDRFGDLKKLPLFRFLYLDSDREGLMQAGRGAPEISFQLQELVPLPLQPISHYRRRHLDQLAEWLPREKLYAIPRNLQTQGSRALARLAFTDHYLRLIARLKKELQQACHPDTLYQSVTATGLALRDNVPRVVLVGSATGGSSGYLLDLAYTLRRLLRMQRFPEARINAFLFCGAPEDPGTPPAEQANLFATLTEINHFAEGVTSFTAVYGTDGARQVEQGPPFDAVYLLTQTDRTPTSRRETVAHLGSYLYHELTTPLGNRLERRRLLAIDQGAENPTVFRSFGTHGVWFPRGLLLRLAGRQVVGELLRHWAAEDLASMNSMGILPAPIPELDAACARLTADPQLRPEGLTRQLQELASNHLDKLFPEQGLVQLLAGLEEQCWQRGGADDPGTFATGAMSRVRDWLGGGLQVGAGVSLATSQTLQGTRKSRLNRALEVAAHTLVEEWDRRLGQGGLQLMDLPGFRVATGEAALRRLIGFLEEQSQRHGTALREQAAKTSQAQEQLQEAVTACLNARGGFSWFGGRRAVRTLRVFLDHLAAFARQCLAEDLGCALQQFYLQLMARLRDRLSDLQLLRQRLRQLSDSLALPADIDDGYDEALQQTADLSGSPTPVVTAEAYWETLRASRTTRVVLPDGEEELSSAAHRFVATLTAEHWSQLDQLLQEEVLGPRGGLVQALQAGDLNRLLIVPLVDQAAACLGQYLPPTDVAEVEMASAGSTERLTQRFHAALESATPLSGPAAIRSSRGSGQRPRVPVPAGPVSRWSMELPREQDREATYVLIPASEAGRAYGEHSRSIKPGIEVVRVAGQADLTFCREQGPLTAAEVYKIVTACRPAYEETSTVPAASPHARFDINDWIPLEP